MDIHNHFYDGAKDRRYGLLFFISFLTCLAVAVGGVIIYRNMDDSDFHANNYFFSVITGILIVLTALIWRMIRRLRIQRGNKFQQQQLSRDEILKARSKLNSQIKPLGRAPSRAPDMNLKY